jgi:predicted RNA-binding Zn ribbon-like protein
VTRAKANSKVTLSILFQNRTVATFKATAAKSGKAKVTFHLSKKLAAKYRGKKLTLRLTVTDAKGHTHTIQDVEALLRDVPAGPALTSPGDVE